MSFSPPTMTGYSAFFDPSLARSGNGAEASYNAMTRFGRGNIERQLSMLLARGGFRGMRRVMRVLNGAAAGSAASETYVRAGADQQGPLLAGPGGARTVETVTKNSGNTTAAQQTYINTNIIDAVFNQAPSSYPSDLSGQGGGGKRGV